MTNVLIVEGDPALAALWRRHVERLGCAVTLADSDDGAIFEIAARPVDVILLNLDLAGGGAVSVADYAMIRRPRAQVIFVTASSFFSNGAIFAQCANACACLPFGTAPQDIAAMVDHYGQRA